MNQGFGLTGKRALITGATRGLGRRMAEALAAEGVEVVVVSRKQDACDTTAAELKERYGVATYAKACHMNSWSDIDRLVEWVDAYVGQIDILVNNAGISPTYDTIEGISEELWDKTVGVNLKGPFRLTAQIGGRMQRGTGGSIVNISSVASLRPSPDWLPYSAAKAGLNALTVGYAHALGPKVRVNSIVCGAFLTDITATWDEEATSDRMSELTALSRAGHPDELAGSLLYLVSDLSTYTTGALLRVDGGRV